MSNLKQMGLGVMMYVQDYDERYPMTVGTGYISWQTTIQPYVKNEQLFHCPSSYNKKSSAGNGNYAANRAILIDGNINENVTTLALAAMPSSATTYMIFDGGAEGMMAFNAYHPNRSSIFYIPGTGPGTASNLTATGGSGWKSGYEPLADDFASGRHMGGINMMFADGHVKWMQSHVVVNEAIPCGSTSCFPRYNVTTKSAWNPLVDNS